VPEKRWKAQERRIARLLNAKRNPHGMQTNSHAKQGVPDVENAALAAEIKDRKVLPEWLVNAVMQAKGKATKAQLPLVVLTTPAADLDLVVLDLRDYREWYVGVPLKERR
jgi:hypothetical protein